MIVCCFCVSEGKFRLDSILQVVRGSRQCFSGGKNYLTLRKA